MLTPIASIEGTRSSHRWAKRPGSFDPLNARAIFPSTNAYGVPDLPAADWEPSTLVSYEDRYAVANSRENSCIHFFLDDYRFELVWNRPNQVLSRILSVGASLTPDFSMWRDMPLAMQLWQVYRARWCGAWLIHRGVRVVPTACWSTPETYPFAFAGIARGSTVALSAVGIDDALARRLFVAGYREMVAQVEPRMVLVYGPLPFEGLADLAPVRCYPTRWDRRR